ncbi:hypothetical protein H257_19243 [Aphanomyces astaci]|uniref:Uncharacterized protein n=1 Tax=Aphanomyces astaci TaxID=112090 RepID=W4F8N7_APHAT|nr:hypothetical protein H257_19243 [Aphanomyces astaci]ETV63822.1 hypothetical protein H257_19243 [Aphanomyces astaci]|eukprot:XP_009846692.1 hypothetical protein H257_19243 [Aphanomyces astaci]
MFNCYWRTVERVWTRGLLSVLDGDRVANEIREGNVATFPPTSSVPSRLSLFTDGNLRSLAAQSGVPKTTLVRHMAEEGRLKSKSSYSKPYHTDRRKQASAYGTRNIFSFAVVE